MTQEQISYLASLHSGQWFGFDGEQTYENLWVKGFDKPTISEINQGMIDKELTDFRSTFKVELYKLKIVLDQMGDLDAIEAIIATQSKGVQLAWQNANTVRRNSPTVAGLAQEMSYTPVQLDTIFKNANAIEL